MEDAEIEDQHAARALVRLLKDIHETLPDFFDTSRTSYSAHEKDCGMSSSEHLDEPNEDPPFLSLRGSNASGDLQAPVSPAPSLGSMRSLKRTVELNSQTGTAVAVAMLMDSPPLDSDSFLQIAAFDNLLEPDSQAFELRGVSNSPRLDSMNEDGAKQNTEDQDDVHEVFSQSLNEAKRLQNAPDMTHRELEVARALLIQHLIEMEELHLDRHESSPVEEVKPFFVTFSALLDCEGFTNDDDAVSGKGAWGIIFKSSSRDSPGTTEEILIETELLNLTVTGGVLVAPFEENAGALCEKNATESERTAPNQESSLHSQSSALPPQLPNGGARALLAMLNLPTSTSQLDAQASPGASKHLYPPNKTSELASKLKQRLALESSEVSDLRGLVHEARIASASEERVSALVALHTLSVLEELCSDPIRAEQLLKRSLFVYKNVLTFADWNELQGILTCFSSNQSLTADVKPVAAPKRIWTVALVDQEQFCGGIVRQAGKLLESEFHVTLMERDLSWTSESYASFALDEQTIVITHSLPSPGGPVETMQASTSLAKWLGTQSFAYTSIWVILILSEDKIDASLRAAVRSLSTAVSLISEPAPTVYLRFAFSAEQVASLVRTAIDVTANQSVNGLAEWYSRREVWKSRPVLNAAQTSTIRLLCALPTMTETEAERLAVDEGCTPIDVLLGSTSNRWIDHIAHADARPYDPSQIIKSRKIDPRELDQGDTDTAAESERFSRSPTPRPRKRLVVRKTRHEPQTRLEWEPI